MHLSCESRVRRGIVLAALAVVGWGLPPTAPGQAPTGAIEGHVRDQARAPVARALVFISGTPHAATANDSGYYRIQGVPVGVVELQAAFIGYRRTMVTDVRVVADSTVTIDIVLEATPFEVDEINVVDSRGNRLPVDRTTNVLRLQPGVVTVGESMVFIRGGRTDEAAVYIGGQPGAPGAAPVGNRVPSPADINSIATNAFEEASITTEDAAAQFGNAAGGVFEFRDWRRHHHPLSHEQYNLIVENRFLGAARNPLSTFSIDVDRASYANVRRFIRAGSLPPPDAVRIEELINYFEYGYPDPKGDAPLAVFTELAPSPWHPQNLVLKIGLQGRRMEMEALPPGNLVFLLDVSGSMDSPDKLPLVKAAFQLLVNQLRPQDRVAIVVYAGAAGMVLPSTPGSEKERIRDAIDRLHAGGSTAGGAGIQLAYDVARENFLPEGNNRVILATDGDFNVGISDDAALVRLIESRRAEGTFLTVLGFGTGNYKDGKMEQLANKGNGNFAYIDSFLEAKKVFLSELGATLHTIAKDVKIQIEFNPATVLAYRLIGYENRLLAAEDFNDDTKDAAELGAGHTVTALYEIIPAGADPDPEVGSIDPLKYQAVASEPARDHGDELATVKLRYKRPDADQSRKVEVVVKNGHAAPSADLRFAVAVASFGMLLRDSEYRGGVTFQDVLEWAAASKGDDPHGYRAEFFGLVETVRLQHLTLR